MTYIYVPYDSVEDLVKQFRNLNISSVISQKESANFVLVTPKFYYGIYGGLVYNTALEKHSEKNYILDSVDDTISLIWWNSFNPNFLGDIYALSVGKWVAVTPSIFKQLILNPIQKPIAVKSSYYGTNARRINFLSSSNSDSE